MDKGKRAHGKNSFIVFVKIQFTRVSPFYFSVFCVSKLLYLDNIHNQRYHNYFIQSIPECLILHKSLNKRLHFSKNNVDMGYVLEAL